MPINSNEFLHVSLMENDLTINVSALNLPLFPASVKEMNETRLKEERPRNRSVSRRPFWNWIDSSIVYETFRKFEVGGIRESGADPRRNTIDSRILCKVILKIKVSDRIAIKKREERIRLMKFIFDSRLKRINWFNRANKYILVAALYCCVNI